MLLLLMTLGTVIGKIVKNRRLGGISLTKKDFTFTAIPNKIIDDLQPDLTASTFKVLVTICRKTIGWHKEEDQISNSQLQKLTGMSLSSIKRSIKTLIKMELISQARNGKGKGIRTFYRVNINRLNLNLLDLNPLEGVNRVKMNPLDAPNRGKINPTKESNIKKEYKEKSNQAKPDIAVIEKEYFELYKLKYNDTPKSTYNYPRDRKIIKGLLKHYSTNEMIRFLQEFFNDTGWYQTRGHKIVDLTAAIDSIKANGTLKRMSKKEQTAIDFLRS